MTKELHPKADAVRVGVFDNLARADRAVQRLVDDGVSTSRISFICSDAIPGLSQDVERVHPAGSLTIPAAAAGGALGTLLGGLTAIAGLTLTSGAGVLLVGPFLGSAAAGGIAGGFVGAMATRGFEPEIADFYDEALRNGQILIAVEPADDDADQPDQARVEAMLEAAGATTHVLRNSA